MPPRAGHRYNLWKRLVLQTYGDICWICGHGGARQVDHVESMTEHPELIYVVANGRPAHGGPGNTCPVCKLNCNQIKGGYSIERARRIVAERTGKPEPPRKPKPEESGREWLHHHQVDDDQDDAADDGVHAQAHREPVQLGLG